MKYLLVLILSTVTFPSFAQPSIDTSLKKAILPAIKGDVLYISGSIGSHIYNYISYEHKKLKSVKTVSLNSYGGSVDWALEISKKLKSLKLNTLLSKGHVCASACVYLYSSGVNRIAEKSVWLGVHGARPGTGHYISFWDACASPNEASIINNSLACKKESKAFYDISLQVTNKAFSLMESSGVSPLLREDYYNMPDDANWFEDNNVLKKPDWILNTDLARKYNLVTEVI